MATFTDVIKITFETVTGKAARDLGDLRTKVTEAEGGFGKLKTAGGGLKQVLSDAVGGGGILAGAGLAAAASAALGFGLKAVGAFEEAGQAVLHFRDATGLSADESSRWVAVSQRFGIEADTLAGAFGKLEKGLGKNPELLNAYGVAAVKARDGSIDMNATILAVIDAMNRTEDPAKRAALGAAAFGKGWQSSAKLFSMSAAEVRANLDEVRSTEMFTDADLAKSEDYRKATQEFGVAVEGLTRTLGEDLVPAATTTAKALTTVVDAAQSLGPAVDKTRKILGPLGSTWNEVFKFAASGVDHFRKGIGMASDEVNTHARVQAIAANAIEGSSAAIATQKQELDAATQAAKDHADAMAADEKSITSMTDAVLGETDARLAAVSADQAFTKSLRDGTKSADERTSAAIKAAEAHLKMAADTATATGATLTATDRTNILVAALDKMADQASGPTAAAIGAVTAQLLAVPAEVSGTIVVDTHIAQAVLDEFMRRNRLLFSGSIAGLGLGGYAAAPARTTTVNIRTGVAASDHAIGRQVARQLAGAARFAP